ncbi:type II toxin-antitoxin system Phd/YefM family antitoxin [Nocardioides stalactiti]|uniref:type II toxin-antitoxin system Phd/YefM family antitoxin n=1 Tax=Nocardioides stalactiti TaxID=2755356 RepID=UPI0016042743|nr:type II toxin-antitoxin system Phd/YefM family antitoxin [Nocardioides stalactiti]
MSAAVTPSQLRQDIYRLIDRVLETGEPLEIERKGRRLRIVADAPVDRLSRIRANPDLIVGDPGDLASIDWSAEWDPDRALNP